MGRVCVLVSNGKKWSGGCSIMLQAKILFFGCF